MKLIARAPLTGVSGADYRPGDAFEADPVDAKAWIESGLADAMDEPKPDKGKADKGKDAKSE